MTFNEGLTLELNIEVISITEGTTFVAPSHATDFFFFLVH